MRGYVEYEICGGCWPYVLIYREDGALVASIIDSMWDDMQNNYGISADSDSFIEDALNYLDNFSRNGKPRGEVW